MKTIDLNNTELQQIDGGYFATGSSNPFFPYVLVCNIPSHNPWSLPTASKTSSGYSIED